MAVNRVSCTVSLALCHSLPGDRGSGFEHCQQPLNSSTGVHEFYYWVRLCNLLCSTRIKNAFPISEVHSTENSSVFFPQSLEEQLGMQALCLEHCMWSQTILLLKYSFIVLFLNTFIEFFLPLPHSTVISLEIKGSFMTDTEKIYYILLWPHLSHLLCVFRGTQRYLGRCVSFGKCVPSEVLHVRRHCRGAYIKERLKLKYYTFIDVSLFPSQASQVEGLAFRQVFFSGFPSSVWVLLLW